jgi:hypothetical protein
MHSSCSVNQQHQSNSGLVCRHISRTGCQGTRQHVPKQSVRHTRQGSHAHLQIVGLSTSTVFLLVRNQVEACSQMTCVTSCWVTRHTHALAKTMCRRRPDSTQTCQQQAPRQVGRDVHTRHTCNAGIRIVQGKVQSVVLCRCGGGEG